MHKIVKRILISVILISVIAIIVLLAKLGNRLPENPEDHIGNTAGNLYNRGLFAEDDSYIYFANAADNFRLYRMDHSLEKVTRLCNDSVEYVNVDAASDYLYYSRINYRKNTYGNTVFDILDTGVYRFKIASKGISRLYPDACGSVLLGGNALYFQTYGEDGNFDLDSLPTDKNKSSVTKITTDYILPVNYQNGRLYYSGIGDDHCLYSFSPQAQTAERVAQIDCTMPIVTEEGTYFLSLSHNYALFYLPKTSNTATALVEKRISSYNISGDGRFVFYQADGTDNNGLYCYNTLTGNDTLIVPGDYKNLNVASRYLFFTDFNETICYCYDSNTGKVSGFMPTAED